MPRVYRAPIKIPETIPSPQERASQGNYSVDEPMQATRRLDPPKPPVSGFPLNNQMGASPMGAPQMGCSTASSHACDASAGTSAAGGLSSRGVSCRCLPERCVCSDRSGSRGCFGSPGESSRRRAGASSSEYRYFDASRDGVAVLGSVSLRCVCVLHLHGDRPAG